MILSQGSISDSSLLDRSLMTPVWAVLKKMGMVSVNGLALDDRSHFQPAVNHMPGSAPDWCTFSDLPSA